MITALAGFLAMSRSIIRLDLSRTEIGDCGVAKLCKALCYENHSLRDLDIMHTGMSSKGLFRVMEVVVVTKSLQRLCLGEEERQFSEGACRNFVVALQQNQTLKFMELYNFCNSKATFDMLKQVVFSRSDKNQLAIRTSYWFDRLHEVKISKHVIIGDKGLLRDMFTIWWHS